MKKEKLRRDEELVLCAYRVTPAQKWRLNALGAEVKARLSLSEGKPGSRAYSSAVLRTILEDYFSRVDKKVSDIRNRGGK